MPWYEQIAEVAKNSACPHADETGWRVNGQGCWLWCFTNDRNCYYNDRVLRGQSGGAEVLHRSLRWVLITDFWAAYDSVAADDRQKRLPHLLRELEKVDQHNPTETVTSTLKTYLTTGDYRRGLTRPLYMTDLSTTSVIGAIIWHSHDPRSAPQAPGHIRRRNSIAVPK